MLVNKTRALQLMNREKVDALLGTTIENTYYFSGLWCISSAIFPRDSQVYVLIEARDFNHPIFIVPTSDVDCLFECFEGPREVYPYGTFYRELFTQGDIGTYEREVKGWVIDRPPFPDPFAALIASIRTAGLHKSRIAVDEKAFRPAYFDELKKEFPKAQFISGSSLIQEIRAVKTHEEVRRLQLACQVNEQAISDAISIAKEGATERELLLAYRSSLVRQGAMPVFDVLNFGTNTAFGNLYSSDHRLTRGQHIRFDVGCRYLGYVSDLARIYSLGEPSELITRYYMALRAGNEAGVSALLPGKKISEIFELITSTVRDSGLPHYRRHHTGHGIGIEIYQPPLISPNNSGIIEDGMVLAIESPYFELGLGGIQIEDMVHVTGNGAEYLSNLDRSLTIIY